MSLAAGRLRESITIESAAGRVRVGPGHASNWAPIATVRAEVLPVNGGEAFSQGLERGTQFYRVTIRHRDDVTPQHRLIWHRRGGDVLLNVRTCDDPDNRRQALLMSAESGVPA